MSVSICFSPTASVMEDMKMSMHSIQSSLPVYCMKSDHFAVDVPATAASMSLFIWIVSSPNRSNEQCPGARVGKMMSFMQMGSPSALNRPPVSKGSKVAMSCPGWRPTPHTLPFSGSKFGGFGLLMSTSRPVAMLNILPKMAKPNLLVDMFAIASARGSFTSAVTPSRGHVGLRFAGLSRPALRLKSIPPHSKSRIQRSSLRLSSFVFRLL